MQGMSLVPSVTELVMAELLYLQYDAPEKPINLYINSTGVTVRISWPCTLPVMKYMCKHAVDTLPTETCTVLGS